MRFRLSRPLLLTFVSAVRADDEGIDALITVVPTPGVGDDGKPSYKFGVGSVLESFEMWHAIYVNWSVYFGAEEVKTGLELAARAAAGSRSNLN